MWIFLLMAFTGGIFLAVQAAINSQLAIGLGGFSLLASFVSFLVGSIALAGLSWSLNQLNTQSLGLVFQQQWWMLIGGLLGAFLVFTSVFLAPKLGISNMLILIIIGQLLAACIIDHYGLIRMPIRPASISKIIGLVILLIGLLVYFYGDVIMRRFS